MKLRILNSALLLVACISASAGTDGTGWTANPGHPQLQYRITCFKGAATVEWRNDYPGAVTVKAHLRSSSYDGTEDVQIQSETSTKTPVETMYCASSAFRLTIERFSMASPRNPPPASAPSEPSVSNSLSLPTLLTFEPATDKLPEITLEELASIKPGMHASEVLHELGTPLSRLTIPETGQLIETYRYNVAQGKASIIRLSNAIVTEIKILPLGVNQ